MTSFPESCRVITSCLLGITPGRQTVTSNPYAALDLEVLCTNKSIDVDESDLRTSSLHIHQQITEVISYDSCRPKLVSGLAYPTIIWKDRSVHNIQSHHSVVTTINSRLIQASTHHSATSQPSLEGLIPGGLDLCMTGDSYKHK